MGSKPGGYPGLLFLPIRSGHSSLGLRDPGLQSGIRKCTARHLRPCFRRKRPMNQGWQADNMDIHAGPNEQKTEESLDNKVIQNNRAL